MIQTRPSLLSDLPRQRELWSLAFGDSGEYMDNFYHNYYRPERVLLLEEDGVVQAMTAWFDTTLTTPEGETWRAGYLYAVATHPDARGKGFAGQLLAYAKERLAQVHHCQALTTVPAQLSLHRFFAAHGFQECFIHRQVRLEQPQEPSPAALTLRPVTAQEYGQLREELLADRLHIAFPVDALEYQAGCCRASGGGLYKVTTPHGPVLICAEGMEDGTLLVKELLGGQNAEKSVVNALYTLLPTFSGWYRAPGTGVRFGMLQWLSDELTKNWDWTKTAYMGLGFD